MKPWIVCQLGAREHYAFPRALSKVGYLDTLITDAWVQPNSALSSISSQFSRSLLGRYHPELASNQITSFTPSLISFEAKSKFLGNRGWAQIMARNGWFQKRVVNCLKRMETPVAKQNTRVFSYSYTALGPFKHAKNRGWKTVLGQIDPGIIEEKKVIRLHNLHSSTKQLNSLWQPAPSEYWESWREECALADTILVNSTWSKDSLINVGIPENKVVIVPLAYQPPVESMAFRRTYPSAFTQKRPLRVLFLGQIVLRKGIASLLKSISWLDNKPIEIWLVGPSKIEISSQLLNHPQLKYIGKVARSEVQSYYKKADMFLFPTHSDGFGLTQLEAQAWHLPIIASKYCGEVVKHRYNGFLLEEITPQKIAAVLCECCLNPQLLQDWSAHACDTNFFTLEHLSKHLERLNLA